MFEDCKGPKFEELLAVFSSAVLMKIIQKDKNDLSVVKSSLWNVDLGVDVVSLVLAYGASVSGQLRAREVLQRRWLKFSRTIEIQRGLLEQRALQTKSDSASNLQKKIPQRTLARLKRLLVENWQGDGEWVDIILQGDQHRPRGSLLELTYSNIWQHASNDTLYTIRPRSSTSCLKTLESRIEEQRTRLDRWKLAQSNIEALRQRRRASQRSNTQTSSVPVRKYSLRSNIAQPSSIRNISTAGVESSLPTPTNYRVTRHRRSKSAFVDLSAPISVSNIDLRKPLANTSVRLSSSAQLSRPQTSYTPVPHSPSSRNEASLRISKDQSDHDMDMSEDFSNESSRAEDIVRSILNSEATTPYKIPLSLVERTRISMASMGTKQNIEFPDQGSEYKSYTLSDPMSNVGLTDLAERTRMSMSMKKSFPVTQACRVAHKSRPSASIPINQFETPRKVVVTAADTSFFDETIIDLDEENIFKSRPKVALSPMLSPVTDDGRESLAGVILKDESYEDDFS